MLTEALRSANLLVGDTVLLPPSGIAQVSLDFLLQIFPDDATYEQLVEIDGGTRGYSDLFASLRQKGLL